MFRQKRRSAGLGLIEVIFALFIFVMMGLMFAAVLPAVNRSTRYSSAYAMASQIAQHKIDQVRSVGFAKCDGPGLFAAQVIDSATPVQTGANSESFGFTTRDRLLSYFPAGATGVVTVENWAPSFNGATHNMRRIEVAVTWRDVNGPTSSFVTAALVGAGGD